MLADLDQLVAAIITPRFRNVPLPIRTRASPGAVIQTSGSSSTPRSDLQPPLSSAASTLPCRASARTPRGAGTPSGCARGSTAASSARYQRHFCPHSRTCARARAPRARRASVVLTRRFGARRLRVLRRFGRRAAPTGVSSSRQEAPGVRRAARPRPPRACRRRSPAALLPALGAHVDHPVGELDHVEVVLDHDDVLPASTSRSSTSSSRSTSAK